MLCYLLLKRKGLREVHRMQVSREKTGGESRQAGTACSRPPSFTRLRQPS